MARRNLCSQVQAVATQTQDPLQLQRAGPAFLRCHPPSRPEPQRQGLAGVLENRDWSAVPSSGSSAFEVKTLSTKYPIPMNIYLTSLPPPRPEPIAPSLRLLPSSPRLDKNLVVNYAPHPPAPTPNTIPGRAPGPTRRKRTGPGFSTGNCGNRYPTNRDGTGPWRAHWRRMTRSVCESQRMRECRWATVSLSLG